MSKITAEILTDEQKEDLAKNIRLNGGEVVDKEFKELQDYLKLNPPETKYLDN